MQIHDGELPRARQLARTGKELSREARVRLGWMDFYRRGRNVARTCRHFGISRQTFYRWRRRYDPQNLATLEPRSHRPHRRRQPTWSPALAGRVLALRQQFPRWGKDKLVVLLAREQRQVSTSMVGRILTQMKRQGRLLEPPLARAWPVRAAPCVLVLMPCADPSGTQSLAPAIWCKSIRSTSVPCPAWSSNSSPPATCLLAANENTGFFLGMVKPQPGDISIVDNAGTFLMWYDMDEYTCLTGASPSTTLSLLRFPARPPSPKALVSLFRNLGQVPPSAATAVVGAIPSRAVFQGEKVMARKVWIVALLLGLSAPAPAQTKAYRFSKTFITAHYTQGNPIGILAASASSPAKNVHPISCGGKDGELHIGVPANAVDNQGVAISGPADGSEQFGIVAEPPNVTATAKATIDNMKGQPIQFAGYFRVWNEGHDVGAAAASNPHHVLEVHPVWGLQGGSVNVPPKGSRVFPMKGYAGYGASKFRPLLSGLLQQKWLKVAEDNDFVFVQLLKADNFYQLPVIPRQIKQVPRGVVAVVDVYSDEAHQNRIYQNLTLVTAEGSRASSQLQADVPTFMLGFFSVNLATAMRAAAGHQGPENAVFAPAALEFFAFGRPTEHAVASSACNRDIEADE